MSDLTENRMWMVFYAHCLSNPNLDGAIKYRYKQIQYTNSDLSDKQPDLVYCNNFSIAHWYDAIDPKDVIKSIGGTNFLYQSNYVTIYETFFIVKDEEIYIVYFNYNSNSFNWTAKKWNEISYDEIGQERATKITQALLDFYKTNYKEIRSTMCRIGGFGFEKIYLF